MIKYQIDWGDRMNVLLTRPKIPTKHTFKDRIDDRKTGENSS